LPARGSTGASRPVAFPASVWRTVARRHDAPSIAATLDGVELAWARAPSAMGFAMTGETAPRPDESDERLLNRAIWSGASGFNQPYFGDPRILWPGELVVGTP
jgi:hypothetical protein